MSVTFEVNDQYFWWKMSLVLTICHIIRLYNCEYWLWRNWSRTHLIPGLPVPHIRSPNFWSLWTKVPSLFRSPLTDGLPKIGPPGQRVPCQFGPSGQMVPKQFGPPGQTVPKPGGRAHYAHHIITRPLRIFRPCDGPAACTLIIICYSEFILGSLFLN